MLNLTIDEFQEILPNICDIHTSLDASGWTSENPLWGHCAVVSLLAQNLFGGSLLRASLTDIPELAYMRSHYWNMLANGKVIDFTKPQFRGNYPRLVGEFKERPYVLSYPETEKRYKELVFRLARWVGGAGSVFDSAIYKKCFLAALDSPCQKMMFGCVITYKDEVVYEGCNETIEPLKKILGACGHAEEGMWKVIHGGIPISECKLYVAGLYSNGLPWIMESAVHTCLQCAVQMYNAKLQRIYVPTSDGWAGMTPEEALKTAQSYAMKVNIV